MKGLILRVAFLLFALLWITQANAASCFWVGGTASWTAVNTASWASSSGGTTGTCGGAGGVPGSGDSATFDAASGGGTVTVNTNFSVLQLATGAFTGTIDFSANNNSPTIGGGGWSNSGTGTRTINCGSGTFNFPSSAFSQATSTNLTFTCGSATFSFTGTYSGGGGSVVMGGGGQTIGTLTIGANTGGGVFVINPNSTMTVGTLNVSAPQYISQSNATTLTVTNAININGSSSNQIGFISSAVANAATISSANNGAFTWAAFRDMTFTGGGTFTATSSFSLGDNTGITITAPASGGGGSAPCIKC